MFRVMHGEDRCPICIRLGNEECTHLPVNSDNDIKRKGVDGIRILVADHNRFTGEESSLRDLLPEGEVDVFDGYTKPCDDESEVEQGNVADAAAPPLLTLMVRMAPPPPY